MRAHRCGVLSRRGRSARGPPSRRQRRWRRSMSSAAFANMRRLLQAGAAIRYPSTEARFQYLALERVAGSDRYPIFALANNPFMSAFTAFFPWHKRAATDKKRRVAVALNRASAIKCPARSLRCHRSLTRSRSTADKHPPSSTRCLWSASCAGVPRSWRDTRSSSHCVCWPRYAETFAFHIRRKQRPAPSRRN
jgi:hypothetical protein